MLQFIQVVPRTASVAADIVARNMDWPGADEIAERLKRTLPPEITGEAPPVGARIAAIESQAYQEALAQAGLARAQGLAVKSQADAAKARAQAQDARLRTLSNAAAVGSAVRQDALQAAIEEAALRELPSGVREDGLEDRQNIRPPCGTP
jgi:hypothetical protein